MSAMNNLAIAADEYRKSTYSCADFLEDQSNGDAFTMLVHATMAALDAATRIGRTENPAAAVSSIANIIESYHA